MKFFGTTAWWLLLVLFLGGCQRTVYQGQAAAEAARRVLLLAPEQASATITTAAPPRAPASASETYREAPLPERRPARRQPRRARRSYSPLPTPARASTAARAVSQHPRSQPKEDPITKPVRYRSRGIALLLAVLSLTYLPLGLHNFYLGYYGRGALAIAAVLLGTYLVVFAFLGSLLSSTALLSLGVLGLGILGGWFIWQIVDIVRIITKDLKPKNGDYYPEFFQTSPRTGHPSRTD